MKKYFALLCALVMALAVTAAPAEAKKEKRKEKDPLAASTGGVFLYSTRQEIELGEQVRREVLKQYKLYQDSQVVDYVRRIGAKVASYADRQNITYQFFVLDDPLINAFALPGGAIYITRGILTVFNNEAELAGVLGHEIGHVVERHSMKHMQGGTLIDLGWAVFGKGREMPLPANIGLNVLMMSYGRGDELKSDALGLKYAYQAGYQADSMIAVFEEFGRRDQSFMPEFLRSHPVDERRTAQIRELWSLIRSRSDIRPEVEPLRTNDAEYAGEVFPHTYRVYFPEVRKVIEDMVAAIGRKDIEGMMKHVAKNFRSSWLNLDYEDLKEAYADRFKGVDRISATVQFDGFRFLSINTVSVLCRMSESRVYADGRSDTAASTQVAVLRKRPEKDKDGPVWLLVSIEDGQKW